MSDLTTTTTTTTSPSPFSQSPPSLHEQNLDDSKKRTRVTPSQLAILEETFTVSATPDSKMRKQLASKLDMPERSIQIWFQNRRAKVKMLQRRALLRQEQEVARARLCAEATNSHPYAYWYPYPRHAAKLPIHRAWSSDMIPPPPPPPPLSSTITTTTAVTNHIHPPTPHSSIPISAALYQVPPPPPPPFHNTTTTTIHSTRANNNNINNNNNNSNNSNNHIHHHHNNNHVQVNDFDFGISPSPTAQQQAFIMPRRMESEPPLQVLSQHQQQHSTTSSSSSFIGNITATAVTVGSWHRMKINQQDLMCYYRLADRVFTWHIQDSNYHFKMIISFDSISSLELSVLSDNISAQIDIDLLEPPIFYMEDINKNNGWVQCSDFTEGMQASCVLRHTIRGLASDLHQELLNIVTVDQGLDQIARFPVIDPLGHASANNSAHIMGMDQAMLMSQGNWRHQSLPPATVRDYWTQHSYPI